MGGGHSEDEPDDSWLSEHLYLYCEDDPVNAVDPSGFSPAEIALGAAGGIAIADGPLPIGDIIAVGIVIGIIIIEASGKKGKERIRDTGLQDLPDEIIRERARDKSLPSDERARYRREEKARKERNKQKRSEIILPSTRFWKEEVRDYRSSSGASPPHWVA
ncbi:MAG: hypothetical protein KatS3mg022_3313 [Armatimonadota bacterium]|nr:MAG: hypothetical protein KatS3mg022_3313 [Armatimonadota bacterium]